MAKSKSQMRELLRGASDRITGPRLTARIERAAVARCPKTGERVERQSEIFRKMEARFAPR